MEKFISILDKVTEYAVYGLVFIIPFSKAGIEIFAVTAIIGWVIKRTLSCFTAPGGKGGKCRHFLPQTPLYGPLFCLIAVYLVSMAFSVDINESLEGVFFKLAEYILIFFICADIFSQQRDSYSRLSILLGVVTMSTLILFADAVFQWISGRDFIKGYEFGGLRASFSTANDFAGYLIAILPIFFCVILTRFKKRKPERTSMIKAIYAILFLAGLIMLCATFARGAWLGYLSSAAFLLITLFLYIRREKKKLVLKILSIIFILAPLIAAFIFYHPARQRAESIRLGFGGSTERFYRWKEALAIIEDFPLFGTGPNTYTMVSSNYDVGKTGLYPHNSYLQMGAEVGILGLAAFIWMVFRFFSRGLKSLYSISKTARGDENNYNSDILFLGIASGILAVLVQSFFDTNLYALQLVVLFWVMLGVGTALIKDKRWATP